MKKNTIQNRRNILGILLLLIAINAFAGGWYGLAGAEGLPVEWLDGSPFETYRVPSLFLLIIIGGLSLFSAVALFGKKQYALRAALLTGVVLAFWIIVQVWIIGLVSWMQPVTFVAALVVMILSRTNKPVEGK